MNIRRDLKTQVSRCRINGRQLTKEEAVVRTNREREHLLRLVRRPRAHICRPTRDQQLTSVLFNRLVRSGSEARIIVSADDCDNSNLRSAGINAAVLRPAVVHQGDGEVGHPELIRRLLIAEVAGHCVDRRQLAKERIVVRRNVKSQRLTSFVFRPCADVHRPTMSHLQTTPLVFHDLLVLTASEARRSVHRLTRVRDVVPV